MIMMTAAQLDEMVLDAKKANKNRNEKIWTLLVADLLDRSRNRGKLLEKFCGKKVQSSDKFDIWFEAQPLSPRKGKAGSTEGNTRLDLAFGNIQKRGGTGAGIEYGPSHPDSWACFVEAKCKSDCSVDVVFDPWRNQLTRVIENLLCFHTGESVPNALYFTLLTPRLFEDTPEGRRSRFYAYKFAEYRDHPKILLDDIYACKIPYRHKARFLPENLEERLSKLKLNWVTFESIFESEEGPSDLDIIKAPEAVGDLVARIRTITSRVKEYQLKFSCKEDGEG